MGAKVAIETSFKKLVMRMPYDKITVAEICREAHLSRKTFYANFQDKEAVFASMFERDAIGPMRTLNETLTFEQAKSISHVFTENLYAYFEREKDFYSRLVKPMFGIDDTFIRVVTRAIYKLDREIMLDFNMGTDLQEDYMAYFFASSQAMFCQKWIADGMPMTPKQLAELYHKMTGSFWLSLPSR